MLDTRKKLTILLVSFMGLGVIFACFPLSQSQVETAMTQIMETAEAEAEKKTNTQMAGIGQTAEALKGTLLPNLPQTAVSVVGTKVASVLTPQPPKIEYEFNTRDIILLNVVREISVAEASFKFSVPVEQLIELNREKYPSITDAKSKLEPDWRLVLYIGSPEHSDLIPERDDDWKDVPGCIENQVPMISIITCNQYTVDFAKEVGLNIGCLSLDSNPLGYYIVRSRYQGLMLFYSAEPFIYSLYYDEEKKSVTIGPVILTERPINLPTCGIPGNP